MVLMGYSGAGGKLIHKKTRSKKSRDTVPLRRALKFELMGKFVTFVIFIAASLNGSTE